MQRGARFFVYYLLAFTSCYTEYNRPRFQAAASRPSLPRCITAVNPKWLSVVKFSTGWYIAWTCLRALISPTTCLASSSVASRSVSSSAFVMIGPARSNNSGATLMNRWLSTSYDRKGDSENVPFTDGLVHLRICRAEQMAAEIYRFLRAQVSHSGRHRASQ